MTSSIALHDLLPPVASSGQDHGDPHEDVQHVQVYRHRSENKQNVLIIKGARCTYYILLKKKHLIRQTNSILINNDQL